MATKKRTTRKKSTKPKAPTQKEIQMQLTENFVKLQKVMANLSIKFDTLSDNMTKLLQLFEIAAKSFVQKQEEMPDEAHLLKKIDTLLDQNSTIANGLTLVEEKIRHKLEQENDLSDMNPIHSDAELHGVYPHHTGKPKPGNFQRF